MTTDPPGLEMIVLVPDLRSSFPARTSINMSIRPGPGAACTALRSAGIDTVIITGGETECACCQPCWARWTGASASSSSPTRFAARRTKPHMMNVYMNRFGEGRDRDDTNPT